MQAKINIAKLCKIVLLFTCCCISASNGLHKEYPGTNIDTTDPPVCPDQEKIPPCKCEIGEKGLNIRCSGFSSLDDMESLFQQEFPSNDFYDLVIEDSDINSLRSGSFGNLTFREIYIEDCGLERIERGALSGSYHCLFLLNLWGNKISYFPFEDLPLFKTLFFLELSQNEIIGFPSDLQSDSLNYFYMDSNDLAPIPADGFKGMPALRKIAIDDIGLTEVLPGTFTGLPELYSIGLEGNKLTYLQEGIIEIHGNYSSVFLRNNSISNVEVNAITGVTESIILTYNELQVLEEDVWRPFLQNGVQLMVSYNPLVCECDIAWLIRDPDFVVLVSGTCEDGTDIKDLDPADFKDC